MGKSHAEQQPGTRAVHAHDVLWTSMSPLVVELGQRRQIHQQESGEQGSVWQRTASLEEVQAELFVWPDVVCILGRRVCVFARPMPQDQQFVGRQVVFCRIGEKATMDLGPEV